MNESALETLLGINSTEAMNEKVRTGLLTHFCSFAVLLLLKDWCDKQEDPRTTAGEIVMKWRKSVMENYQKTIANQAQTAEENFGVFGKMLSESLAPQEKVDQMYYTNLEKVVKALEFALGIEP